MKEIELKAHVYDRKNIIEKLESFSTFVKSIKKYDTYYHLQRENSKSGKPYVTARIREEYFSDTNGDSKKIYLTYKNKELSADPDGEKIEINDERETVVENRETLEILFADIGFTAAHKKQKIVESYETETDFGNATLELCTIPELGDFIEIEILSENPTEKKIQLIQQELKKLLKKCNIPLSQIEEKYYTKMLREIKEK